MCKHFIACIYGHCNRRGRVSLPLSARPAWLACANQQIPSRPTVFIDIQGEIYSLSAFLPEEGGPQRGGRSLLKALLQSRLRRASFLWEEALKREREHRRGRVSRPDPPSLSMCKVRFTLFQPSSPREVAFSQENDGRSVLRKAPSVASRQLTLFSAKPARLVSQPDATEIIFPEILSKALYNGAKMC